MSFGADTMRWIATPSEIDRREIALLQLHLDAHLAFAGDLDGRAVFQVRLQHGGTGPIEVPAIFDCDRAVVPGKHGGQGEGPIAIALIAAEQQPVSRSVLRYQHNHRSRKRLVVSQYES